MPIGRGDPEGRSAVIAGRGAVYFLGFSYGFRPGRNPHHALDALTVGVWRKKVNWVLDAEIRDFFTNLDHGWLGRFLEHRIADDCIGISVLDCLQCDGTGTVRLDPGDAAIVRRDRVGNSARAWVFRKTIPE